MMPGRQYNILWVVMDAFRTGNLGLYGYPRPVSPGLDALAARSTVFERMVAAGIPSPPAAATMLTGVFPANHGHEGFEDSFAPEARLLPDICRAEGYASAAILGNPLFHKLSGFNRFDELVDIEDIRSRSQDPLIKNPTSLYKHSLPRAEDITAIALDTIGGFAGRGEKFCMFLWFMDTHENYHRHFPEDDPVYEGRGFSYNPPQDGYNFLNFDLDIYRKRPKELREITEEYRRVYDGEVKYFDRNFARILGKLDELGIAEETVIVVVGDHGTALAEHGLLGHRYANLHEELVRVPCILHVPGLAGRRVANQARTVDLLPTVLDCAGIPVPPGMDGFSLKPAVGGASLDLDFPSPLLFAWPIPGSPTDYVIGYREWPWKLVADLRPGGGEYLYNLDWDPEEASNLRHRHDCRETVEALWGKLRAHYAKYGKEMPGGAAASHGRAAAPATPPMTPELRRRLELLGYL